MPDEIVIALVAQLRKKYPHLGFEVAEAMDLGSDRHGDAVTFDWQHTCMSDPFSSTDSLFPCKPGEYGLTVEDACKIARVNMKYGLIFGVSEEDL